MLIGWVTEAGIVLEKVLKTADSFLVADDRHDV